LNLDESLKRRIDSILKEAERRGFEAVVFFNEVIGQNPSNFVYVSGPWGLGDEHGTLVFDLDGGSTVVMPHWGAKRMEESGRYDRVIAVKQEKGHHIKGTLEALAGYDREKLCFDISTLSAQFAFQLGKALDIGMTPDLDISDHVFKLRTIKDEFEIAELRRVIALTEGAVLELMQETRPGRHTMKLKKRLDAAMIEKGAVEFSFESSLGFARGPRRPYGVIKHGRRQRGGGEEHQGGSLRQRGPGEGERDQLRIRIRAHGPVRTPDRPRLPRLHDALRHEFRPHQDRRPASRGGYDPHLRAPPHRREAEHEEPPGGHRPRHQGGPRDPQRDALEPNLVALFPIFFGEADGFLNYHSFVMEEEDLKQ
jgi:hypothetical protein